MGWRRRGAWAGDGGSVKAGWGRQASNAYDS